MDIIVSGRTGLLVAVSFLLQLSLADYRPVNYQVGYLHVKYLFALALLFSTQDGTMPSKQGHE